MITQYFINEIKKTALRIESVKNHHGLISENSLRHIDPKLEGPG